jgi:cytochrome c peroxidase
MGMPCHRMTALAVLLFVAAGCQRAGRFPPALPTATQSRPGNEDRKPETVPANYGWLEPQPPGLEIPLRFVSEDSNPKEWEQLSTLWTEGLALPHSRLASLGLAPLEAAVTLTTQLHLEGVTIKVPRGLPDPAPLIPPANPPTYGKWALGKRLFFDSNLLMLSSTVTRSCADCHRPAHAYTLNEAKPVSGKRNVPSLLNSVYNRHQFWDGRARTLEEVLLRRLDDEGKPREEQHLEDSPGYQHVFPGLVGRLRSKAEYHYAFQRVFGRDPTVDNTAKALATYLRTLLSGDSVVDEALANLKRRGKNVLEAQDFETALLSRKLPKESATSLLRGHELFNGKARCHVCHSGPLFTDHGFHNVGIGESNQLVVPGKEPGRFAVVPYGLKDRRLVGAFKTPTLRNVSLTAPYMHDGSLKTLGEVLKYFNDGPAELNAHVDPELIWSPSEWRPLRLELAELSALEQYLGALRGNDLPAILTEPARK